MRETGAIIGRVGSGKTYTAKGIVERMLADQTRVCIIDPTGVWWGLRSSADGKSPAFAVVVFGGEHADVPLTEGMGGALAETLASQNLPAIVDVSEFTMSGRVRFMTAFLEDLYHANRLPLTLIIDEADLFAPQRPGKDQLTMLGRMEQICRRGRVRGFRPWLITQRPAALHKAVLSQANTLIAMQLTAPQDRDALGDWIEGQADRIEGKRILAELPKLKKGEGFVWAPHHEILERVKFPPITTFDSSRSPEDGVAPPPVKLAPVDLSKIGESLRQLEEEAEEDDPEALHARIAELEEQIATAGEAPAGTSITQDDLDAEYERGRREASDEQLQEFLDAATPHVAAIQDLILQGRGLLLGAASAGILPVQQAAEEPRRAPKLDERSIAARDTMDRMPVGKAGAAGLSKAERLILSALAQYPQGRSHVQVAVLAGYTHSGGGFRNALGALRTAGRIVGENALLTITPKGKADLGPYQRLPTGKALLQYWMGQISKAERKILEALAESYPKTLTPVQIANRAGYEADGGGFRNALGRLRTLELAHGRAEIKASPDFFQ